MTRLDLITSLHEDLLGMKYLEQAWLPARPRIVEQGEFSDTTLEPFLVDR